MSNFENIYSIDIKLNDRASFKEDLVSKKEACKQIEAKDKEISSKDLRIKELYTSLKAKEQEILDIRKQIEAKDKEISSLNKTIQDKDLRIKELYTSLKAKEQEILDIGKQNISAIETKDKEISELNEAIKTKETQIQDIKKETFFDLYEKYKSFDNKYEFNNFREFVLRVLTSQFLKDCYFDIRVFLEKQKIEEAKRYINFFNDIFDVVSKYDKKVERLEVKEGDMFNTNNCLKISGPEQGKISKIFFIGFSADGYTYKSMVEIK